MGGRGYDLEYLHFFLNIAGVPLVFSTIFSDILRLSDATSGRAHIFSPHTRWPTEKRGELFPIVIWETIEFVTKAMI